MEEKILAWRDFPTGEVYKVLSLNFLISRFNKECRLLTVANKRGDITKVWISRELASKLAQKEPNQIPLSFPSDKSPVVCTKWIFMNFPSKVPKQNIKFYMKTTPKKKKKESHIRKALQCIPKFHSKKKHENAPQNHFSTTLEISKKLIENKRSHSLD